MGFESQENDPVQVKLDLVWYILSVGVVRNYTLLSTTIYN